MWGSVPLALPYPPSLLGQAACPGASGCLVKPFSRGFFHCWYWLGLSRQRSNDGQLGNAPCDPRCPRVLSLARWCDCVSSFQRGPSGPDGRDGCKCGQILKQVLNTECEGSSLKGQVRLWAEHQAAGLGYGAGLCPRSPACRSVCVCRAVWQTLSLSLMKLSSSWERPL